MAAEATALTCAVIVLNWNGRAHLEALLPSLYAARARWEAGRAGRTLPIVIVDNRSTAGDVDWLHAHHPDVEVVIARANDFLFSLNPAVAARTEDVVVILNNDMRVDPDFLEPLVTHFADPAVFAVAADVMNWEGTERQLGRRLVRFERFWCYHWFDRAVDATCYTAEAGGGCSAYRRAYFTALGGFDPLYRPAYWEDFDLTYRAWMRGWPSMLEPRSTIYHRGSATMTTTIPEGRLGRIMARNQFLFIVSNVGDWRFLVGMLAFWPYRLLLHASRGNWSLVLGQLASVPRLAAALRRRGRRNPVLTSAGIARAVRRSVGGAGHTEHAGDVLAGSAPVGVGA